MPNISIGLDMMGGDFAPLEAVKGLALYLKDYSEKVSVFCIGNKTELLPLLKQYNLEAHPAITVIDAPEKIGYDEPPTKALKEKANSSIAVGFGLLAKGTIDAFISAGNTGAMLVGAMFSVKAIEGVLRPSIGSFIPKIDGSTGLLLDVGLNADCKPEFLNQFAVLGSIYASKVLGIDSPKVALLNIGEEKEKGNALALATYPLLEENTSINFIGNVEGRDVFTSDADVIVTDGFTGNIILKLAESVHSIAEKRGVGNDDYFKLLHYETYGGTPVLGINKPVIIAHGISNDIAFKNMIHQAEIMIESKVCESIKEAFC